MKKTSLVICILILTGSINAQKTIAPPTIIEKKVDKLDPSVVTEIQERIEKLQQLEPLLEAIDPSAHSNGCGPSWLPGFPFLINQQTFKGKDSITGITTKVKVNFKPACDLHDAGYAGLLVINRFGASPLDYAPYTKAAVDQKFFYDLCKICDATIPGSNKEATEKCKWSKLGAWGYHFAVKEAGFFTFDCNPNMSGFPWKQPCTRAYNDPVVVVTK